MSPTIKRIRLSYKKKAKQKCLFFNKAKTRKRIYINALATFILKELINDPELTIREGEAHSDNFFLAEAFDISDIKINNVNLDTRCIINNDFTQLWIPKKPYQFGFIFDFYVAISINTTTDKAEVVGYVTHDDIKDDLKTNTEKINYYIFDIEKLRPIEELEKDIIELSNAKPDPTEYKRSDHDIIQEMFTAFLDNQLSSKEKTFFDNHVRQCDICREELLYLHLFNEKIRSQKNTGLFVDANAVLIEEPILETIKEYTPIEPVKKPEEPEIIETTATDDETVFEEIPEEELEEETVFEEISEEPEPQEEEDFEEIPEEPEAQEEEIFEEIPEEIETYEAITEKSFLEEIDKEPTLEEDDVFEEIPEEPEAQEEEDFEEIPEEPDLQEVEPFTTFNAEDETETIAEEIPEEPDLQEVEPFTPFDAEEETETIAEETAFEEISEEPDLQEVEPFTPFDAEEETETIDEETAFEEISEEPDLQEVEPFTPFDAEEETETIAEETAFEEISEEPDLQEVKPFTPFDAEEEIETIDEESVFEEIDSFAAFETSEPPPLEDSFELITPEETVISSEDDLLAEAKEAESFLDSRLGETGIEETPTGIESTEEETFSFEEEQEFEEVEPFTPFDAEEEAEKIYEETTFEEIPEEPIYQDGVSIEEEPVSTIEEDSFLTLEDLEEEHVDTLQTFDDKLDLESIEKSATIEEPSFESDFSDFTSFQEEVTATSEPEPVTFEPDSFVVDSFDFDEPASDTIPDTTEETDSKLEDLEEEFNTLASFNFEEEPVIGIEPIETIQEETYVPESVEMQPLPEDMFEEHGADISSFTEPEIPAIETDIQAEDMFEEHGADISSGVEPEAPEIEVDINAEDMFEVPEGMENMFDAPAQEADTFSQVSDDDEFETIGSEEVLFEELPESEQVGAQSETDDIEYKPVEYKPLKPAESAESSTTIEDPVDYMPAGGLQDKVDQLAEEFEQQQEEVAAIDETTDSVVPTDTEIADLKEFAEKKKDSATTEVKKAKKGKNKKFVLLAASLLLIGTITAGVVIIAPSFTGLSNRMLTSLPTESPANKLKRQSSQPKTQAEETKPVEQTRDQEDASTRSDLGKEVTPHEIESVQPPDTKKLLAEANESKQEEADAVKEGKIATADDEKTAPAASKAEKKSDQLPAAPAPKQKAEAKAQPAKQPAPKPVDKVVKQPAPEPAAKPAPKPAPKAVAKAKPKAKTRKPVTVPPRHKRSATKSRKRLIASKKSVKTAPKPVIAQNKDTIRQEHQQSLSFLPEKNTKGLNDGYNTLQADVDTNTIATAESEAPSSFAAGRSSIAAAPANDLLAGLTEKKESIKQNLNPNSIATEKISYITSANVYWKPTTSKRIEASLKSFINSSTQRAKSSINASLKNNNISGEHTSTTIIIKINNSTNSIIATIGSTSGSSRVDNLILNAVRKGFSAQYLPKSDNNSDIIKIKLMVALQH